MLRNMSRVVGMSAWMDGWVLDPNTKIQLV